MSVVEAKVVYREEIAGGQYYKCVNRPGVTIPQLSGLVCATWARGIDSGSFDGGGYQIKYLTIGGDNKYTALCISCHLHLANSSPPPYKETEDVKKTVGQPPTISIPYSIYSHTPPSITPTPSYPPVAPTPSYPSSPYPSYSSPSTLSSYSSSSTPSYSSYSSSSTPSIVYQSPSYPPQSLQRSPYQPHMPISVQISVSETVLHRPPVGTPRPSVQYSRSNPFNDIKILKGGLLAVCKHLNITGVSNYNKGELANVIIAYLNDYRNGGYSLEKEKRCLELALSNVRE